MMAYADDELDSFQRKQERAGVHIKPPPAPTPPPTTLAPAQPAFQVTEPWKGETLSERTAAAVEKAGAEGKAAGAQIEADYARTHNPANNLAPDSFHPEDSRGF